MAGTDIGNSIIYSGSFSKSLQFICFKTPGYRSQSIHQSIAFTKKKWANHKEEKRETLLRKRSFIIKPYLLLVLIVFNNRTMFSSERWWRKYWKSDSLLHTLLIHRRHLPQQCLCPSMPRQFFLQKKQSFVIVYTVNISLIDCLRAVR